VPSFIVVIPARYASTRLPGKPLLDIAGWPMIRHGWALARRSAAAEVIITADDARIVAAARGFGADACLSSTRHRSGTERIAALVTERGYAADTLIVNLQSDEPMMPPALLGQVAAALAARAHAQAATLCEPLPSAQADDPGMVKVVFDAAGRALYFSRAAIPWSGAAAVPTQHYRHLGLYAYRAGYLAGGGLPGIGRPCIEGCERAYCAGKAARASPSAAAACQAQRLS